MLNNRVILRQAVEQMYAQLPNWSEACANYAALDQVWTRQLSPEPNEGQRETHTIAQAANWENLSIMFNPGRVRSTTAKVEKGVPTSRPCFLCQQNRPREQKWVEWRTYEVLVNPYPIFSRHLTIVCQTHTRQSIVGRMADMVALTRALDDYDYLPLTNVADNNKGGEYAGSYMVFFNGACCGASAPDHCHFQAVGGKGVPFGFLSACRMGLGEAFYTSAKGWIAASESTGRLVYCISPSDDADAEVLLKKLCELRAIDLDMCNIMSLWDGDRAEIWVVPRRAFRPWQFTAEGEEKVMVSPATVEICGMLISPRSEDYESMTETLARDILKQVTYAHDTELQPVKTTK